MTEETKKIGEKLKPWSDPVRLSGVIALVLIFLASLSLTWNYLSDSSARQEVAAAAVSLASAPDLTAFEDISLQARSAIVVDLSTGYTLYTLNPDSQWPLASLTKIALVLAVAESVSTEKIISIPYDAAGGPQRLRAGERWRVQDVIDFTLTVSSNGGANVLASIAEHSIHERHLLAPQEKATLWRMNDLAGELGLTHTYFLNVTGLDESPTQAGAYGSARDIATLFAYAASTSPETFAATTKTSVHLTSVDGVKMTAINTDEALPDIPGVLMGKTGYTDLAGGNLAILFETSGHRIAAVVLGSSQSDRFEDMRSLVAAATKTFSRDE